MADKQHLYNMVDNFINKKNDEAQIDFHNFAKEKMRELLQDKQQEDKKNSEKE